MLFFFLVEVARINMRTDDQYSQLNEHDLVPPEMKRCLNGIFFFFKVHRFLFRQMDGCGLEITSNCQLHSFTEWRVCYRDDCFLA